MVAKAIKPDYGLSSHVAPLGLIFSQGQRLAPAFADGAFIGEHGSWDRSPLNGYKVIFVPVHERPPERDADRRRHRLPCSGHGTVRGRPVGLALDRTGRIAGRG